MALDRGRDRAKDFQDLLQENSYGEPDILSILALTNEYYRL